MTMLLKRSKFTARFLSITLSLLFVACSLFACGKDEVEEPGVAQASADLAGDSLQKFYIGDLQRLLLRAADYQDTIHVTRRTQRNAGQRLKLDPLEKLHYGVAGHQLEI